MRYAHVVPPLLLAILLAACGPARPATPSPAPLAGKIVVGGSGAAYPLLQILSREFSLAYPSATFEFRPSSTTGAGLQLVSSGDLDVAGLARDLTPAEAAIPVELHWVASDAIAVAVNPSVKLSSLSTKQLRDIYTGRVRTWEQLGASDGEIVVIDRPEDETAKIVMRRIFGADLAIDPAAVSMSREVDMVAAVEKTPGAIGYFSVSYIIEKPSRARAVAIDGVPATLTTLADGSYPAVRRIGLVVRPGAAPLTRAFVAFVASTGPRSSLEAAGYVSAAP